MTILAHTPSFHAYVDFSTDAVFDFSKAVEITSDIERLDITGRGKNLLKQQAEAACWTVVLKNANNKYTPSYSGSSIYPNLLPGKHVWALMGYPADTWNGMSVGDTLASYTRQPDHDATFAAWAGGTAQWKYGTSGLYAIGLSSLPVVLDFGESYCHVGALIQAPAYWSAANETPSVVFRYTDANNYWRAGPAGGNVIYVQKIVAGVVVSTLGETFTWPAGEAHWLTVEIAIGDVIRVCVDNVGIINSLFEGDTFNNTATKHGIGIGPSTASIGGSVLDFGGYRPVFSGRVDTWTPDFNPATNLCTMVAYDDMERLYMTPVLQTTPAAPTTAGDIINTILTAPYYPIGSRVIDVGTTLLISAAAGQERLLARDALTEIHQVEGDDVGFFWIDGAGVAHYESWDFRGKYGVIRTWYGARQNGNEADTCFHYQNSDYDDGKDRVLNDLIYNYYFTSVVPTPVWSLNNAFDKPKVLAHNSITLCAIGPGDQMANIVHPLVGTTDFTVNTAADGSGTDITSSCTADILTGFSGNVCSVVLTNNSASDGYVTFCQLRADIQQNTLVTGARGSDSDSQQAYGLRRQTWDTLHIADFNTAQAQVIKLLNLRKKRLARWQFVMTNATQANLMQIIHRTISERVTVVHAPITLNSDFYIERWSLSIPQNNPAYMECTWELQAAQTAMAGYIYEKTFTPTETTAPAGTISVVYGSTAVNGSGTNFTNWFVGDQIFLPDGNWYSITQIESDTIIRVSAAYIGADTSGFTYKMKRMGYVIPLTVHRATGTDSGTDVYISTHCKADYSDIRFTTVDGDTLLPYWVEHSSITSGSAKVWVKIPELPSDASATYLMLYGKASAVDGSDGLNTFDFFDDFLGTTLNGKWTSFGDNGYYTVGSSILSVTKNDVSHYVGALAAYQSKPNTRFRCYGHALQENPSHVTWGIGANSQSDPGSEIPGTATFGAEVWLSGGYWQSYKLYHTNQNGSDTRDVRSSTLTSFTVLEIRWILANCKFYENDTLVDTITTNVPQQAMGFLFFSGSGWDGSWGFSTNAYVDWCFAQKLAPSEPTFGTWGAEE